MRLYAVRVFVRQWDEACAFYRDRMQLPERYRNDEIGWVEYDLDGPCLGIQRVAPDDEDGNALVGRFLGVSLRVEDIEASYRELMARGVHFTDPPEQQPWEVACNPFTWIGPVDD